MKVKELLESVQPVWKPNPQTNGQNPVVTVILPTFKRAECGRFECAVESVIHQSYVNWELIIVDDASTDGTEDLIGFYMSLDPRIHSIRHTHNLGLPAISEYEGYTRARGQYIAFIFDDNEWDPDHLMVSLKSMVKNNVKFTFGTTRLYDKNNATYDLNYPLTYIPVSNPIGNGSVVLHRSVIEDVGLYDPHLSLTRLCDWDLWRRIINKYIIHKNDMISTREYGLALNDSLGNTVDLNNWISLEQMSYDRTEQLRPENFPDYDIISTRSDSTNNFSAFLDTVYNNKYTKKKWYTPLSLQIPATASAKKRILIVAASIDATYYLSFDAIFTNAVFKVMLFANLSSHDFEFADAIIFIRDIENAIDVINKYSLQDYESYFYFDDNYFELVKDVKHVSSEIRCSYQRVVELFNRKTLNHYFDKLIVSTESLKSFCDGKRLHRDIRILPPSSCMCSAPKMTESDDTFRVAFLGGSFREDIFIEKVYPALKKLAANHSVELICPDPLAETIEESEDLPKGLTVTGIPRNFCYPQIIQYYRQKRINVLVHPGEKINNNKYKTLNSLINAVSLGAVLITSDVEPYSGHKELITCPNDMNAWYNALRSMAGDANARTELYRKAEKLVTEEYAAEVVGKVFKDIIKNVKQTSTSEIIQRYEKVLCKAPPITAEQAPPIPVALRNTRWDPDSLVFSGAIPDRCRYVISTTATNAHRIGVIFTSLSVEPCEGEIICRIYGHNNIVISESSISMNSVVNNNWCYFSTGDILMPARFVLELEFKYAPSSGMLGVYEIRANRSLIYKVAKKLKLPYYGVNVPLIDVSILD